MVARFERLETKAAEGPVALYGLGWVHVWYLLRPWLVLTILTWLRDVLFSKTSLAGARRRAHMKACVPFFIQEWSRCKSSADQAEEPGCSGEKIQGLCHVTLLV